MDWIKKQAVGSLYFIIVTDEQKIYDEKSHSVIQVHIVILDNQTTESTRLRVEMVDEDTCGICLEEGSDGAVWIKCSKTECKSNWFHVACVNLSGLNKQAVKKLTCWVCPCCYPGGKVKEKPTSLESKIEKRALEKILTELPKLVQDAVSVAVDELKDAIKDLVQREVAEQLGSAGRYPLNSSSVSKSYKPNFVSSGNVASLSRQLKKEESQRIAREKNVVIYGTKPETDDKQLIHEIANAVGVSLDGVKLVHDRIGKKRDSGEQVLRVAMSVEKKWELVKKAKILASSQEFNHVFVRPDLTIAERQIARELREKLKEMREKEPSKRWKIWRGTVIEVMDTSNTD